MIKLEQLADPNEIPNHKLPPLDRIAIGTDDVDERALTPLQNKWVADGYVILRDFMPHQLVDAYRELRCRVASPGGWKCPTPYMYFREIRDLSMYRPLTMVLKELIGEEMGLHLNLTGWVSTERAWHQDDYLNPDFVNSWYAATWIALEDIKAESGPFEFVPGSHKWPLTRKEKVFEHLEHHEKQGADWPWHSEKVCAPAFEEYIERTGSRVEKFLAKKGDVLIWHGRLAHRGGTPEVKGTQRKCLISHYSAVSKRLDMTLTGKHKDSVFFIHKNPLDAQSPWPTI